MSELAKAIRWTTPGAVALTITLLVVVWTRACTQLVLSRAGAEPLLDVEASNLLTGAALSIPIGFLVYQAYFFNFSRPFVVWRAVRADLGNLVLDVGPVEIDGAHWVALPSRESLLRVRKKVRPGALRRSAAALWLYKVEADGTQSPMPSNRPHEGRYYEILETHHARLEARIARCTFGGSDTMRAESSRLADIYHTLGACRWALMFGWVGGLGWSAWTSVDRYADPVPALAPLAVAILAWIWLFPLVGYLFVVMHVNRRHSFDRRVILLRHMLEADDQAKRAHRIPGWRGSRA
ncbi:hypothetical protein [Nocardioides sp.]|uniref:hypothetical protein n=1 Tax=Nocardioides sp. TaxID=35761 RepID=UPI00260E5C7A|nr:hypothetical protein [Nocardioides sp.]